MARELKVFKVKWFIYNLYYNKAVPLCLIMMKLIVVELYSFYLVHL